MGVGATIAVRVRAQRLAKGWSLEKLAEAAGLSRDAVVRIERGDRNPRLGTTEALAAALEVPLVELIAPSEEPGGEDARILVIRAHLRTLAPELADRVVRAVVAFCGGAPDNSRRRRRTRRAT
ncbi:MAG: helix-turn-helix transcriptional regulator [Myxococcaceae bacterium]|nr:helix-turn-helix transcriptional regulator [Myxococcaceae bacterium]